MAATRTEVEPSRRGDMWFNCSGGAVKKESSPDDYRTLVASGHALDPTAEPVAVLYGDVPRTGVEGVDTRALRDLLLAFVASRPNIGYCQSMAPIAASVLLHSGEERAFWTFMGLVEDVLPVDYFSTHAVVLRADLRILQSLTRTYLPELHAHLVEHDMDLSPVTMTWLHCLFVKTLPTAVTHKIFDRVLQEGSHVVFRTALALLRYRQVDLLGTVTVPHAYQILKAPLRVERAEVADEACEDVAASLFAAIDGPWLVKLSQGHVSCLREQHISEIRAEDLQITFERQALLEGRPLERARRTGMHRARRMFLVAIVGLAFVCYWQRRQAESRARSSGMRLHDASAARPGLQGSPRVDVGVCSQWVPYPPLKTFRGRPLLSQHMVEELRQKTYRFLGGSWWPQWGCSKLPRVAGSQIRRGRARTSTGARELQPSLLRMSPAPRLPEDMVHSYILW